MDWQRPSPRLWIVRQLQVGVPALVALAIAAATPHPLPAVGAVAAVAVAAWAMMRGRVRSWRYAERADDLILERGVLMRRVTVVPYGRMQFLDVAAGPVERVFGLASVRLHTAAAASDAHIPGLPAAEASRLRDRLAVLGEARAVGL